MKKRGWTQAAAGGALLGAIVLITVFSYWLDPTDPNAMTLADRLRPPIGFGGDLRHILGTDQIGRDLLSRLMAGGRVSLLVGVLTVAMSCTVGTTLGLVSGYYGKWRDTIITVAGEIQLALPAMLIIILVLSVLGPSIATVAIVLAISDWVIYSRTSRGRVMAEKAREYISAARLLGASDLRIVFKHVLPNIVPTLLVVATVQLGTMILLESSLSYLGLGVQRPASTWGRMVADGQPYLREAWWASSMPGLAIGITVVAINLLGDGLRRLWKME